VSGFDKHMDRVLAYIKQMRVKVVAKDDAPKKEAEAFEAAPHCATGTQFTALLVQKYEY
jgi:hypothetical protein